MIGFGPVAGFAVAGVPKFAGGIVFDAAANSGFQIADNDYAFARTVGSGTNRYLTVKVPILGAPGTTVTAVTDDHDGTPQAMTFIGRGSSGTGAGIVEFWGLIAPATGTKNIRVQLSGSVTSAGLAASYFNVHQTSPQANFNSNSATNVGAADATVNITTVASGSWVVSGLATDDPSVTAGSGFTARNNVSGGAANSGADADTNGPVSAGTTAASFTGVGAGATWVISGFELRPDTAAALGTNRTTTDAPTVAESITRLFVGLRASSDSPTASESVGRVFVGSKTATDNPTTLELATRIISALRTTTSNPQTSESSSRTVSLLRTTTDSPQTSEQASQTFTGIRTTVDNPATSDVATAAVGVIFRTATESMAASDSASKMATMLRLITEAPQVADVASRVFVGFRAATDIISVLDVATPVAPVLIQAPTVYITGVTQRNMIVTGNAQRNVMATGDAGANS